MELSNSKPRTYRLKLSAEGNIAINSVGSKWSEIHKGGGKMYDKIRIVQKISF